MVIENASMPALNGGITLATDRVDQIQSPGIPKKEEKSCPPCPRKHVPHRRVVHFYFPRTGTLLDAY